MASRFGEVTMKVLIAEDDATSRRMLSAILGKWNYEVTTVDSGEGVLDRLLASADAALYEEAKHARRSRASGSGGLLASCPRED